MLIKGTFLFLRENLVRIPHFAEEEPKAQRGKMACPHCAGQCIVVVLGWEVQASRSPVWWSFH